MTQGTFNPNDHVIKLKSKQGEQDYLPVQWRLVWFRLQCPDGTIDTEELCVDLDREVEAEVYAWNNEKRRNEKVIKRAKGYARYKAIVTDGKGGRATGTKSENAASFPDFVEKAETGAIGRALAGLGYGTQFAPELDELPRIVDAPVESRAAQPSVPTQATQPGQSIASEMITDQQLTSIQKICAAIGRERPDGVEQLTSIAAGNLIRMLTAELRAQRPKQAAQS